ncbi:MAG: hypothetical protein LBD44_01170 [Spirochaetaceae bacterium]|nr:hypothetical protein [Spirochaetaceae bacterium]
MKTMIWIDDTISRLTQISVSLSHILWTHNVCNKMILVGDNYREEEPEADRKGFVDKLQGIITNLFYQFCYEQKGDDTLDEYYKKKESLIPTKPYDLPDNSSCDDVVRIIDKIIQNNDSKDTVVIGVDIRLNREGTESKETLTDEILKELSNRSNIKIFIYSWYNPDLYPTIKPFIVSHKEFVFFREQRLLMEDSDEQKEFLKFFGIGVEDVNLTK